MIGFGVLAVMGVVIWGCVYYDTTLHGIRTTLPNMANQDCFVPQGLTATSRSYDWACGSITSTVCRDNSDTLHKAWGKMTWQLPDGFGGCVQGNNGNTFHWTGIDATDNLPNAQDGIRKWRHETCATAGFREGKGGRVVRCNAVNYDLDLIGDDIDFVE
jgi:hypothetical protein